MQQAQVAATTYQDERDCRHHRPSDHTTVAAPAIGVGIRCCCWTRRCGTADFGLEEEKLVGANEAIAVEVLSFDLAGRRRRNEVKHPHELGGIDAGTGTA